MKAKEVLVLELLFVTTKISMILAYRHQYFGEILFLLCGILGMKNFNLSPGYHQKDSNIS